MSTFIQVHTNWQKYWHVLQCSLTELYTYSQIYSRFTHRSGLCCPPVCAPVHPNRSVPTDPVLGLHSRYGQCWACISTVRLSVCCTGNARRTDDLGRRVWGYIRLWINAWWRPCWDVRVFRAIMMTRECQLGITQILRVRGITGIENVLSALEQGGGSLCGVSTLLMSCPTEINGLESWRTCQTLCSTSVEPRGRLSSIVPIPMMAQCCDFSTRTESECRVGYCRNSDWWGVTWYEAPESRSHVLDSWIVCRTFDTIGFSMDSMFGSLDSTTDEESM